MPYSSNKQRVYLHIHEPQLAAKWDKEYGGKIKKKNMLSDYIKKWVNDHANHAMYKEREIPKGIRNVSDAFKLTTKQKTTTMKNKSVLSGIKTGIKNTGKGILGTYKTAFKNWVDDSMERNFPKKKNTKAKLVVNNKMKAFGQMDPKTNIVEVNLKKHKGDKTELANTIHHELLHVKHPDMSERDVKNKADRETELMSPVEKQMLVAKVRNKKLHYKQGAIRRKFKMKSSEGREPGSFIRKANEARLSKRNLAIRGLV